MDFLHWFASPENPGRFAFWRMLLPFDENSQKAT